LGVSTFARAVSPFRSNYSFSLNIFAWLRGNPWDLSPEIQPETAPLFLPHRPFPTL
jgi:hypothetical protein